MTMTTTPAPEPPPAVSGWESALLRAEHLPWAVLYRVPIGYAVLPLSAIAFGPAVTGAGIVASFLAVLVALRIGPGVLRRGLPCSKPVKAIWAERR